MSLRSLISKIIPNSTPAHLRENTANIARDRLQVILSRERGSQSAHLSSAEFQQLSNQLLQVVGVCFCFMTYIRQHIVTHCTFSTLFC